MPLTMPKVRITCNLCKGKVSVSKLTLSSIFNATCRDCSKKAPPMPFVRNRALRRILKLLMSK